MLVLAEVDGSRPGDADNVDGIDQERMLMVAGRAQHMTVVEQTQVDQLRRRVWPDRRDRPHVVGREVGEYLGLACEAQRVSTHPECRGYFVNIEPIGRRDNREPIAIRRMKHNRLRCLLRRQMCGPCLSHRRLAMSVFDHVKAHAVIAEVQLELRTGGSWHPRSDYSPERRWMVATIALLPWSTL